MTTDKCGHDPASILILTFLFASFSPWECVSLNPDPSVCGLHPRNVNARSMQDKVLVLSDLVTSKGIDLLGITETWLTTKETSADLAEMTLWGFPFLHEPRARQRGGRVGLLVSSVYKFSTISLPTRTSFEAMSGKLECGQSCFIIINIYRPPGPATTLFSELQDKLSYISTLPHDVALMRDFNICIHFSSSDAGQCFIILESFNLLQYVDVPTYIHGHSLDLMICSSGCNIFPVSTSDSILDNFSVGTDVQIPSNHSRTILQTIKYGKLQLINIEAVKADILNSDRIRYPKTNVTELAKQYDSILYTLINLHALLVSKTISLKPPNPCMIPAILAFKQHLRYLEHIWHRTPTELNRSILTRQTQLCNREVSKAKSAHYSKSIAKHSGDYGSLWKAFNKS